jgi:hypothetical protein
MSRIQEKLIENAIETFHEIFPCSSKGSFKECFSIFDRKYLFWFNTADHSTHLMTAELAEESKN